METSLFDILNLGALVLGWIAMVILIIVIFVGMLAILTGVFESVWTKGFDLILDIWKKVKEKTKYRLMPNLKQKPKRKRKRHRGLK